MKKRIMALAMAGVLSMGILAGCGGDTPATTSNAEAPAATEAPEATEAPAATEAPEATEAPAEKEAPAEEEVDVEYSYDTGFYVNDGSSDAVICFFEGSDGSQVAYLFDGEDEIFAEYDVAEAELEDGTPYMLVQVGEAVMGYFTDGDDWYIVDEEGNIAVAAELSEEEADALLSAVEGSDDAAADVDADEDADADFTYDSGFYVNDGSSDAIICFFEGADGSQVAYVNDGENEVFAEYDAVEAELEDGTPYMLVQVGDAVLGYLTDGDDWYIVDEDGNLAAAAELSEEEAEAILEAVAE